VDKKSEKRIAERRAFLKKAGVAAATVPAAALLLSAQAKAFDAVQDPYAVFDSF
jgi:formiminotetrahydrofolate cyclodeaminase